MREASLLSGEAEANKAQFLACSFRLSRSRRGRRSAEASGRLAMEMSSQVRCPPFHANSPMCPADTFI